MSCSLLTDFRFLDHDLKGLSHPENPNRINLLLQDLDSKDSYRKLLRPRVRQATDVEILRVHTADLLAELSAKRGNEGWIDADTYYGPKSIDTAFLAAGALMDQALDIWRGKFKRGFAVLRPPGHHATREQAMGFCLLNSVALATAAIKEESPNARLAIVDFDLHHGNGTQAIFNADPNILFISSHRHPFYPGTGVVTANGSGKGMGTKVNLPLAFPASGDFVVEMYRSLVVPMLKSFRPEMILVSAGFDGHESDPMQGLRLKTSDYGLLTDLLLDCAELTTGKSLFVLEGGYSPEAVRDCGLLTVDRLLSEERPSHKPLSVSDPSGLLDRFRSHYRVYFPGI